MPDETVHNEGDPRDPGPIETGSVENITVNDPGPIEIDAVMKNLVPTPVDPMEGRDLHMGEVAGREAESGERRNSAG